MRAFRCVGVILPWQEVSKVLCRIRPHPEISTVPGHFPLYSSLQKQQYPPLALPPHPMPFISMNSFLQSFHDLLCSSKKSYICNPSGEVSEWLKEHAWKVCMLARVSRVRIPLSPHQIERPCDSRAFLFLGTHGKLASLSAYCESWSAISPVQHHRGLPPQVCQYGCPSMP